MFVPHPQLVCVAVSTLLMASWGGDQWRRHLQTWEAIAARVQPMAASPSAWTRFRSAGVAMELADCAERRCLGVDRVAIAAMREDAMQVRMAAAKAMIRRSGSRRA